MSPGAGCTVTHSGPKVLGMVFHSSMCKPSTFIPTIPISQMRKLRWVRWGWTFAQSPPPQPPIAVGPFLSVAPPSRHTTDPAGDRSACTRAVNGRQTVEMPSGSMGTCGVRKAASSASETSPADGHLRQSWRLLLQRPFKPGRACFSGT